MLAFEGIEARAVDVQVQVTPGLPAFHVVGLADKAVSEARERVRSALVASEGSRGRCPQEDASAAGCLGPSLTAAGDIPRRLEGHKPRESQVAIAALTARLVALRDAVRASNSLKGPDAPIDELQLAQLVALLESTLAAIRAPYVEVGHTRGFFNWMKKVTRSAAEKGLERGLGRLFDQALEAGRKAIEALTKGSGPPDLGGLSG